MISSIEGLTRKYFWDLQRLCRRILPYSKIRDVSISTSSFEVKNRVIREYFNDFPFTNYKQNLSLARKTLVVHNVTANARTGIIWTNGRIFKESSVWPVIDLLQWEPTPIFPKSLSGEFILLPDNGYYHFLIEELPRFLDALNRDESSVVIYGSSSSYVADFLDLSNLCNRATYIPFPVKLSSLKFSEKSVGGIATIRDIGTIKKFIKSFVSEDFKNNASIFISRRKSGRELERGFEYYTVIERLMHSIGVLVVYLEDYTLQEQIRLIGGCHNLIGFHGAGLANLIWMKEESRVTEVIFERQTSHFEYLSAVSGHTYRKVNINQLIENPSMVLEY